MLVDQQGHELDGGNGVDLTERQRQRVMRQNATIADVNEIASEHARQACNHLGNQLPAFVHKVVAEAIQGFYESLTERGMLLPGTAPVVDNTPSAENVPTASEGGE